MNSRHSKSHKVLPNVMGYSLTVGVLSGLALWNTSYWRPWVVTLWSALLIIAVWAFIASLALKLNEIIHPDSESSWGEIVGIYFAKFGLFAGAIYGLCVFTLFVVAWWVFSQPSVLTVNGNQTIYQRCVWLETNDCTYTEPASWFTSRPSNYSPEQKLEDSSLSAQNSAPADSSPAQNPADAPTTPVEPASLPPHTPATSAVSEDSILFTPAQVPGAGSVQKLSVVQDGDFYQSTQLVDGAWVRGGDITAIGMHRDVYDVIPLDDHVWVIGFGTPEGGENFITTDAGATWSAFLPDGFTPGGSEPSFLEKAKADKDGYSITTNYPSWTTNAGPEDGVNFYSPDGITWEKK